MFTEKKEELSVLAGRLGEEFNSKYELIEKLGKGGFGEVYKANVKAEDLPEKLCAIKILERGKMSTNEWEIAKKLFDQEAQNLNKCQHPNIVRFHEIGGMDNIHYIVMQFVEGKNLQDLINKKKQLPFAEILEISEVVLPALDYIHSKGLVHRDLKPGNIMLDDGNRQLVILDFGLTRKSIDLKTDASTVIFEPKKGSPLYMAPELWEKRGVNLKADIYAYGVILFQMLTGEVPFNGDITQVKEGHLKGIVPDVKQKNKAAPSGIQKVIKKAMAKDPLDRYSNALEFLNAIKKSEMDDEGYPRLEVRKQLADRYTFDGELIGQGQFSKVYSMHRLFREGEFALKIMDFDFTLQHIKKNYDGKDLKREFEKRRNRFIEKANFFYDLQNHPNIVRIDNSGFVPLEQDNIGYMLPYVVLKRIRGVNLEELIKKESPLALEKILKIATGVVSALKEIHEKDYIYWEVLPRKIFIEEKTGNPILLSAGLPTEKNIVKEWVSETKLSDARLVYVREHLPPDHDRKRRGIASDISLLGILLYQMITGEIYEPNEDVNLFEILNEETDDQILNKMRNKSGIPDDILKDLLEIIRKTMAKNRRKRYRNMDMILTDLKKVKIIKPGKKG